MPRPATDKRERLTAAALDLAYREGFEQTSIAQVAAAADVAAGSVYYYFKSKDDVGRAVVDELGRRYRGALTAWTEHADPRDRLVEFIDSYRRDSAQVQQHGCPLGTMCAELGKQSAELGASAGAILADVVDWAAQQFEALGYAPEASRARATHLVAVMQGAAALSHALGSPAPLDREADHLERWVRRSGENG